MSVQLISRIFAIITIACVSYVWTGPNNLHVLDGTSTAEIIGTDIFFEIIDPIDLEYTYRLRPAKDFGAPFNESYRFKNIPLVPVIPKFGCETPTNIDDIEGNVAFIERGDCSFKYKTLMAERAGARAVIITDILTPEDDYFIEMVDDDETEEVHIPAAYLMGKNGNMIRQTLDRLQLDYALINLPVNLTFVPLHKMNQPPWQGW